jgi:hypothetical protein
MTLFMTLSVRKLFLVFFCACFMLYAPFAKAQDESKDFTDVIKQIKKDTSFTPSTGIVVGKRYISILPVVGYAPANGFLIGGVISISKQFETPETKMSSGMLNLQLTSKKQFIVNARSNIYLKDNKWFLQGDWRFMIFTQPTYGLGITNTGNNYLLQINNLGENEIPEAEPMKFNYLRIYEDIVRKVGNTDFYVGTGVAVDHHFDIEDERLNTDTTSSEFYITNHYAYSVKNDFSPTQYYTTGFKLDILFDSRDNVANAYKGMFASFSFRINPEFSKSSQKSIMMLYDFRYYLGLSKDRPRHLIAFWSYGTFILDGNVPYLALPSIGWDTFNRSGRGYIQGRYRGLNMMYAEAEYRYPISRNGLLGGVFFLNGTLAQSSSQGLFDKIAPGLGPGLRVKMDKAARINLTVDYGLGLNKSSGIYFSMQEAF